MPDEKNDKVYPVKALHEFLYALDREWSKFRNGTIISLISSSLLLLVVVGVILRSRHLGVGPGEFVLLIAVAVFLGYSVYAMYSQVRFFSRWERRMGLLLHMEEALMAEKFDEK